MRVLYCDSVFDPKTIEPDYENEQKAAVKAGFDTSLLSFEELVDGNVQKSLRYVKESADRVLGIYRGWMLTPTQYSWLYNGLIKKNIHLINTPEQYEHCHYLPNSYSKIESLTARTVWTEDLNSESVMELAKEFGDKPIIVKDFVKSEKHNWDDACFIPSASDTDSVISVVDKFIELRGNSLNKGIVFRQFEELEFLVEHSKSNMPLTKEFRLFFANGEIVATLDYWEEGDYGETTAEIGLFKDIAKSINSNFFTMDIAKKKNGDWMIMELGDGQVAGFPDNGNKEEFYQKIKENALQQRI